MCFFMFYSTTISRNWLSEQYNYILIFVLKFISLFLKYSKRRACPSQGLILWPDGLRPGTKLNRFWDLIGKSRNFPRYFCTFPVCQKFKWKTSPITKHRQRYRKILIIYLYIIIIMCPIPILFLFSKYIKCDSILNVLYL